ncbi:MAG: zinc metalloprotease [Planctomycetota bacterium]
MQTTSLITSLASSLLALALAPALFAQGTTTAPAGGFGPGGAYPSLQAWFASPQFRQHGYCGTLTRAQVAAQFSHNSLLGGDCSDSSTNPQAIYSPSTLPVIEIPVVFHVFSDTLGTGDLSEAVIQSQLDVLNEDFRAIGGSPAGASVDTRIQFKLADVDPMGNPTNGITRDMDDNWFNAVGDYWTPTSWDSTRYINIYTLNIIPLGLLGRAVFPFDMEAGTPADRIIMDYTVIGRNSSSGPPFDLGHTLAHEMGHQLGLFHVFEGGCDTGAGCYASGDTICDTNNQEVEHFGDCTPQISCGDADPLDNFMNYSDDVCLARFTEEQARRMRCATAFYRPGVFTEQSIGNGYCAANANSTGDASTCYGAGSNSIASNDLVVTAERVPQGSMGYFVCSRDQTFRPNQAGTQGNLCVGAPTGRFAGQVALSNAQGEISVSVDVTAIPHPTGNVTAMAGERWNFQLWYRDMNPGSTSNFSNGYSVVFQL